MDRQKDDMDEDQIEKNRIRDESIRARRIVFSEQQSGLLDELNREGYQVTSVWDLFNRTEPWNKEESLPRIGAAIPLLLRHLHRDYHPCVKEGIVRALTGEKSDDLFANLMMELKALLDDYNGRFESAMKMLWPRLSYVYEKEGLKKFTHNWLKAYRFALCNALDSIISQTNEGEVLHLVNDDRLAPDDRIMLCKSLRRRMKRRKEDLKEIDGLISKLQIEIDAMYK